MIDVKCDLHIHSVLSGCCNRDNTINNIVNMAKLSGLDVISVTDHNSSLNCQAVERVAKANDIVLVYGLEVCSSEEIHLLCYFDNANAALELSRLISSNTTKYKLDTRVYYDQTIQDDKDKDIGKVDYLLSTACNLDIQTLILAVKKLGGAAVAAHVDGQSNSIIAILGEVPTELGFTTVEVTSLCPQELQDELLQSYNIIVDSDAHSLEQICSGSCFTISIDSKNATEVINWLNTNRANDSKQNTKVKK